VVVSTVLFQGFLVVEFKESSSSSKEGRSVAIEGKDVTVAAGGTRGRLASGHSGSKEQRLCIGGNEDNDRDCSSVDSVAVQLSRVWPHKSVSDWCSAEASDDSTKRKGLLLVKVPKAASSTAAGVVLRVKNRHGCRVQWHHGQASQYANRELDQSYLLSTVRLSANRALSSVYYHTISFHGALRRKTPRDRFIVHELNRTQSNFQMHYTILEKNTTADDTLIETVRDIIENYDFIMVAERMEESLVVWAWLTDVSLANVVVMSSKLSGTYYYNGKKCMNLVKPIKTQGVEAYFRSDAWQSAHSGDALLHAAANRSLDRTIETMGWNRFQRDLAEYRRLTQVVSATCTNEAHFPCSSTGERQLELAAKNCYVRDFGCGYPCIDRVLASGIVERHRKDTLTNKHSKLL
jgi:hypothetical protein